MKVANMLAVEIAVPTWVLGHPMSDALRLVGVKLSSRKR